MSLVVSRRRSFVALLVACLASLPALARATRIPPAPESVSPLDQPVAAVWPAATQWNERLEQEYGEFVAHLGEAVSQHHCRRLEDCLRDPNINTVYDHATDGTLSLGIDCADLPYSLRAYFAFKRHLPFGWVSEVQGTHGRDVRYMVGVRPVGWHTWQDEPTPRAVFRAVSHEAHSGMYRTAPDVDTSDFYPVAVTRRAIHPGTIFYDPNGHVLVVANVRNDGVVWLMDGHPDGSLTWKRFGQAFVVGGARLGGGFKNFRPIAWHDDRLTRTPNRDLADYDARAQYDDSRREVNHRYIGYHNWVRVNLAMANVHIDPVQDVREQVRALCRDVADRIEAVDVAVSQGLPLHPHPASLPENIYGTDGEWELFSTPSRDARLKAAVRELRESVAALGATPDTLHAVQLAFREESQRAECQMAYTNSAGTSVRISFETVLDRMYSLSFDPYHCPEARWGARPGSPEFATCREAPGNRAWDAREQRLRNRIDRLYGVPTPLDSGPVAPLEIDPRRLFTNAPTMAATTVR